MNNFNKIGDDLLNKCLEKNNIIINFFEIIINLFSPFNLFFFLYFILILIPILILNSNSNNYPKFLRIFDSIKLHIFSLLQRITFVTSIISTFSILISQTGPCLNTKINQNIYFPYSLPSIFIISPLLIFYYFIEFPLFSNLIKKIFLILINFLFSLIFVFNGTLSLMQCLISFFLSFFLHQFLILIKFKFINYLKLFSILLLIFTIFNEKKINSTSFLFSIISLIISFEYLIFKYFKNQHGLTYLQSPIDLIIEANIGDNKYTKQIEELSINECYFILKQSIIDSLISLTILIFFLCLSYSF